ncbi:hypothetical protein [Streptomyces sp.]
MGMIVERGAVPVSPSDPALVRPLWGRRAARAAAMPGRRVRRGSGERWS